SDRHLSRPSCLPEDAPAQPDLYGNHPKQIVPDFVRGASRPFLRGPQAGPAGEKQLSGRLASVFRMVTIPQHRFPGLTHTMGSGRRRTPCANPGTSSACRSLSRKRVNKSGPYAICCLTVGKICGGFCWKGMGGCGAAGLLQWKTSRHLVPTPSWSTAKTWFLPLATSRGNGSDFCPEIAS